LQGVFLAFDGKAGIRKKMTDGDENVDMLLPSIQLCVTVRPSFKFVSVEHGKGKGVHEDTVSISSIGVLHVIWITQRRKELRDYEAD
jgi:hypothetical protein